MKSLPLFLFSAIIQLNCSSQPSIHPPLEKYFVSAKAGEHLSAVQLRQRYPQIATSIKNGFTAYSLKYKTHNLNGEVIQASGAVFVPDTKSAFPLLNYNHGTLFPSDEGKAPSHLNAYNAESGIGKIFSAAGYVVVMPDYVGYGESKELQHPYGAYNIIANSCIDMLHAAEEFCNEQNVKLNGKNFFAGWSEGAAVSMSVIKQLETRKEFLPTAGVLNAGPYFSSGFVDHILNAEQSLPYMNTYAWVLESYNWIYGLNRPLNYYFTEPAASKLEKNIQANIPLTSAELFTRSFTDNYRSGKEVELRNAFAENDLWNWKPSSRLVLCHGDQDNYVPYFNSQKTYEAMKAKGADVILKTFKGHNHSSGVMNYLMAMFDTFEKLR